MKESNNGVAHHGCRLPKNQRNLASDQPQRVQRRRCPRRHRRTGPTRGNSPRALLRCEHLPSIFCSGCTQTLPDHLEEQRRVNPYPTTATQDLGRQSLTSARSRRRG